MQNVEQKRAIRPLTTQQKLFCQGLAKGLTQDKAYIAAGYSPNGAEVAASKLLRVAKISSYVDELMKPAENAIRLTAKKAHQRLHDIAMGEAGEGYTGADQIRAIAEFNKMTGGYEPEKIEVKSGLMIMLDRIRDTPNIKRVNAYD